jgi:hypothetical protein
MVFPQGFVGATVLKTAALAIDGSGGISFRLRKHSGDDPMLRRNRNRLLRIAA